MAYVKAFNIIQTGSWPTEAYRITIDGNLINPALGQIPAENLFRFVKNQNVSLNNFFANTYTYANATTSYDTQGLLTIDTLSNTILTWDVGAERNAFYKGDAFNSLNINVKPGVRDFSDKTYSYVLYPTKLLLYPTAKPTYNSGTGKWSLTTNTRLISTYNDFYFTNSTDLGAASANNLFVKKTPVTEPLPSTSTYSLYYTASSIKTRIERPVIEFNDEFNPGYFSTVLEPVPVVFNKNCTIRPDSTFITYDVNYYVPNDNNIYSSVNLGQDKLDEMSGLSPTLKSSYVITDNNNGFFNEKQYFQLVQIKIDQTDLPISDTRYCVLSGIFNLQNTNFTYYSDTYLDSRSVLVNLVTGVKDSFIGVSYIAESPIIENTLELCSDTITAPANLGNLISLNNSQNLTWETKYPPHYYTFKTYLVNTSSPTKNLEYSDLTFYLYSSALSAGYSNSNYTTSVFLSTVISSDYKFMEYNLSHGAINDLVRFKLNVPSNTAYLSSLVCYYGKNLNNTYSLVDSPWIPAPSAENFLITYPELTFGELNINLRPTLSSLAGYMDAYVATNITLAENQLPVYKGQPIFISKSYEVEDYMEVDSSFLVSASSWPTRDLRDSLISWYVEPSDQYISINAVDFNGNFIQNIPQYSSVYFGEETWYVAVSGYGPNTITINLSSQKYDEVTNLTSISSLFNYFSEGSLLVGPSIELNNLNEIRTIQLTAAIPYKGRVYDLPNTHQISWFWTYNNESDYDIVPVSAYYQKSLDYTYGEDLQTTVLSAINISVKPAYSIISPNLNTVRLIASIDTENGLIEGNHTFEVDDFPNPSIFNTDFTVNYSGFQSPSDSILSTRDKKYVITRQNDGTNTFKLSAFSDVIPTFASKTLVWNVSSNTSGIVSYTNVNNIDYNISGVSNSLVSLSALNAVAAGWLSAHNIKSEINFYILSPSEFTKQLEFLTIPEYFWNGNYLTLSNQNNYTNILANTAYYNKTSNSQTYYLSANKNFNNFIYYTGNYYNNKIENVVSDYQLVDIPYQSEFFTSSGLPISLTAFNDTTYPEYNGIVYKSPTGSQLTSKYFYIVSNSDNYSPTVLSRNPRLIPYEKIPISFYVEASSLDLTQNRVISVYQTISSYPNNSPIISNEGTITYTLTEFNWAITKEIPAITGRFDLFELVVGDPAILGNVSGTKRTTLNISASSNISAIIPSSTFDLYNTTQYSGDRNLWNSVTQTYTSLSASSDIIASTNISIPDIFISTTYTLTGNSIFVQYDTPESINSNNIIAYITDFGEDGSITINSYDEAQFYSYKNEGTYFISYSALYDNGFILEYQHDNPVFVKNNWEVYDPNSIRFVEEQTLELPWNIDDIRIQPNEWGDSDIFNTSINRLNENLKYLQLNVQTMNNSSPTVIFGWIGSNPFELASGIKWYTKDFGREYYLDPSIAVSSGSSYFSNIKDVIENNNRIFVLDDTSIIALSGNNLTTNIEIENVGLLSSIFINPISIEMNATGDILFVTDPPKNKIYRFDLEYDDNKIILNYTLNVGSLGNINDTNKFNSPSELCFENDNLYVLDYNNNCVKQFNDSLNWIYTYYTEEFINDIPDSFSVHPEFNLVYILTSSRYMYIFDQLGSNYISKFSLKEVSEPILKFIFDEAGEFIYVITNKLIYKYSSSGYFIGNVVIPSDVVFTGGKKSYNRSLLFTTQNCIIKVQDILTLSKVGEGLPKQYWSDSQLIIDRNEFASDVNYNRCLIRIAQNIKTFRNSLNYRLVLATEQTIAGVITYFASVPVNIGDLPIFHEDVEYDTLGVGVNELHIPQTMNKELDILWEAIYLLKDFLDIKAFNIQSNNLNQGCENEFCWSWNATSCYKLKFPSIRICNVNPITYAELKESFPVNYAPTKTWEDAASECCNKVIPPV